MAISLGLRPRNDHERRRVHKLVYDAPEIVGIGAPDDGWLSAIMWISGRVPVWCNDGDPSHAQQVLKSLGLPPLGKGTPQAIIDADLSLDRAAPAGHRPLPAPQGDLPMVTILICTYNRRNMIKEAIDSARAQTWPREILIVNDGSDDGTAELLDGLDGVDGIRVIHKPNGGKPSALNVGIEAANGDSLIVLDDDDRLCPGALHVLGRSLMNHPEASVVSGDTICFHGKSGRPKVYMPAARLPPRTAAQGVVQQVPAMPGASLIRMSAQRKAGLYNLALIRGQDMDMYLRLSWVGDLLTVPLPTFFYRAHDGLRGSAAGQWRPSDKENHDDKFMACVTPIFEARYRDITPIMDRDMSHCWALGLHLRRLPDAAKAEMLRWPGPHTDREIWMRDQVGVPSERHQPKETLLVVDDGDEGALEHTLEQHLDGQSLWVNLEVPRDPLGNVRLYWSGEYAARENLKQWCQGPGPIVVRLSSAPSWAPPSIASANWFPSVPSVDAIFMLAAAMDWDLPKRTRPGLRQPLHSLADAAIQTRRHLSAGQPDLALRSLLPVLKQAPTWPGGWKMAGEAYALRDDHQKAKVWFDRVERLQAAG
jgi:glycosyltransferase involved in cell wall biosynthesis